MFSINIVFVKRPFVENGGGGKPVTYFHSNGVLMRRNHTLDSFVIRPFAVSNLNYGANQSGAEKPKMK